jgi:hypothetical protein
MDAFDPCIAMKAEFDAMALGHWSQALDRLSRQMWAAGCVDQVEPPTDTNWAADPHWPPPSRVFPGNPNDRKPPGW